MDNGLIINIATIGMTTVVVSKMAKVIGQKEISEIIVAAGVLACGILIIIAFKPLVEGIQNFFDKIHEGMDGFRNLLDKLMFWT